MSNKKRVGRRAGERGKKQLVLPGLFLSSHPHSFLVRVSSDGDDRRQQRSQRLKRRLLRNHQVRSPRNRQRKSRQQRNQRPRKLRRRHPQRSLPPKSPLRNLPPKNLQQRRSKVRYFLQTNGSFRSHHIRKSNNQLFNSTMTMFDQLSWSRSFARKTFLSCFPGSSRILLILAHGKESL